MEWFKRVKKGLEPQAKRELPDGIWVKCQNCGEILYKKELDRNLHVCAKCDFHFRIDSQEYIRLLADEKSFKEFNAQIKSGDPLRFRDSKRYTDRLKDAVAKTGVNEAVTTGTCTLNGLPIVLAVMNFKFIGGSMGSVVGEKIARAVDVALQKRHPLIIVSSSGGARMQEGAFSLMQMAKTSARLAILSEARVPYISILTDPTTGGTTASYSMLGDIILAEPKALIGFAGPRVIKQTIGQDLPEGFQRSEFVLQHGFVDAIVHRQEMKEKLYQILTFFTAGNDLSGSQS
jgi:acetyl-CoA carboxylase carboxyl transferase subunit beta